MLLQGYKEMSLKFDSVRRVRGDNYCALRATLFQVLNHSTQLPAWLQDEDILVNFYFFLFSSLQSLKLEAAPAVLSDLSTARNCSLHVFSTMLFICELVLQRQQGRTDSTLAQHVWEGGSRDGSSNRSRNGPFCCLGKHYVGSF